MLPKLVTPAYLNKNSSHTQNTVELNNWKPVCVGLAVGVKHEAGRKHKYTVSQLTEPMLVWPRS